MHTYRLTAQKSVVGDQKIKQTITICPVERQTERQKGERKEGRKEEGRGREGGKKEEKEKRTQRNERECTKTQ